MIPDFPFLFAAIGLSMSLVEQNGQLRIAVRPSSGLTPPIRSVIELHRQEIIEQLRAGHDIANLFIDREIIDSEARKRDPHAAREGLIRCLTCYTETLALIWLQAAMHYALMLDVHEQWLSKGIPASYFYTSLYLMQPSFVA